MGMKYGAINFKTKSISEITIAIDPGHGGSDIGAPGCDGGSKPNEEDLNLDISLMLKELLIKDGFNVFMTRETDKYLELWGKKGSRVDLSEKANSDMLISIHHNSASSKSAKGIMSLLLL